MVSYALTDLLRAGFTLKLIASQATEQRVKSLKYFCSKFRGTAFYHKKYFFDLEKFLIIAPLCIENFYEKSIIDLAMAKTLESNQNTVRKCEPVLQKIDK